MASLSIDNRSKSYTVQTVSIADGKRRSFRLGRASAEHAVFFKEMVSRLEKSRRDNIPDDDAILWARSLAPTFKKRFRECGLTPPTRIESTRGYGIIYAIEHAGHGAVKIGWTQSLYKRCVKIDTYIPTGEIAILGTTRGFLADESRMHADLSAFVIGKTRAVNSRRREWFYLTSTVNEYISAHFRRNTLDWEDAAIAEDDAFAAEMAIRSATQMNGEMEQ